MHARVISITITILIGNQLGGQAMLSVLKLLDQSHRICSDKYKGFRYMLFYIFEAKKGEAY